MEVHQTLRKVTEHSLTLEDCKFLLSKTGEKQSKVLYGNYYRKYHPKNSSMSSYFNHKLMEHMGTFAMPRKTEKLNSSKNSSSLIDLPLLRQDKKTILSDKWVRLIRMTQKQNIIRKGMQFPKIAIKNDVY